MVEWKAEAERDILKRIIALLFALAELADRASLAPFPVRCHVLCILRPAEAVIQAFIINMARDLGASLLPQAYLTISEQICMPDGNDPADATRLALRLRVLALALVSLLAQAECSVSCDADRIAPTPQLESQIELLQKLALQAAFRSQDILPPDTS
jgi:hypothetical protein